MIRFLEYAVGLILLFVFVRFARQAFRRTPPDDRISDEDMMAVAKPGGPKKPRSGSAKINPPKDPY